ncbi:hypothetical protein ACPX19_11340 [Winogradskyella sp. HB-48]|uniref:hypothetical protein n=1 Tax=Winogradskyella sp. HB-48 TaxID=3416808 RepID=UPI003CEB3E11
MSKEILKSKISDFYSEFKSFIESIDSNKEKSVLDKEIQVKYDSYRNPIDTLINNNFPENSDYSNYTSRAEYYRFVNDEFKKFYDAWENFIKSVD